MFDQYIEQLASSDPTQRRQAIVALGRSGDTRALAPLAGIYKHDPDPLLRELALKAGRYLKGVTASIPNTVLDAAALPTNQAVPTTEVIQAEKKPKELTYADRQKAKSRLDSAIGLVAQGNNDRALTEMVDAIRINPELAKDTLALNLASTVTGIISTSEAMDSIVAQSQASRKKKRPAGEHTDSDSSDTDMIMLIIMLLVLFITSSIFFVFSRLGSLSALQAMSKLGTMTAAQRAAYQQSAGQLKTVTPGDLLKGGFVYTFLGLIDAVLLFGVGTAMGGTGSFMRFTTRLVRLEALTYVPAIIYLAVLTFGVFKGGAPDESSSSLLLVMACLSSLTGIGLLWWRIYAVAHNHNVSMFRGCAIIIVASIASIIVGIVLIGLLGVGVQ